jgi:hypothetical protein
MPLSSHWSNSRTSSFSSLSVFKIKAIFFVYGSFPQVLRILQRP